MSKCNLCFLLLAGTICSSPAMAASLFDKTSTQTHINQLELKPASLLGSFKTASICFLGVGDCDPNIGFGKSDDYSINTATQCQHEGFVKLNCNSAQVIDGVCPYNSTYGKTCKCRSTLAACPIGQVGVGDSCGGKYVSCQCSPSLFSCASNQVGQGVSCGGKYQSCVCKSEYQYTTSNCASPAGDSCDGKYLSCDPCGGYYSCGGKWQYCEGKSCSSDRNRCSTNCTSDYFPYTCSSASVCLSVGGIYRDGYCSKFCPSAPAKVEDWAFTCCDSRCAFSECISIVGYNCRQNPHWSNCTSQGGTPTFNRCIGPSFDNRWDGRGPFRHNAAGYECKF